MLLDAKVEKNDGETKKDETQPEETISCFALFIQYLFFPIYFLFNQIRVIKTFPMETWILYLMCVLFYVCVFLFISQGQNFFLEYTGMTEKLTGFVLGIVYIAVVPFNFLG